MRKCIIVCWYGEIPEYFKLWERSCANNINYDFLVFTDQVIETKYPNIQIKNMSFTEIKTLISKKLKLNINFAKSYKFCDFRPAYGVIFEEYLKEYDFWGHCDIDQIFGNLDKFISNSIFETYEKINHNGHFVLYKNNEKMNNLYKCAGAVFNYKEVFQNEENYAFDEYTGINRIAKKNNIKEIYLNCFADIDTRFKRYKTFNHENWKKQIFTFENGSIYRYIANQKEIVKKEEFMYLHFQKKKPNLYIKSMNQNIAIGSKGIFNFKKIQTETFDKINPYRGVVYEIIEKSMYYLMKIKTYSKCSKKEKRIWRIQKRGF